MAKKLFL